MLGNNITAELVAMYSLGDWTHNWHSNPSPQYSQITDARGVIIPSVLACNTKTGWVLRETAVEDVQISLRRRARYADDSIDVVLELFSAPLTVETSLKG